MRKKKKIQETADWLDLQFDNAERIYEDAVERECYGDLSDALFERAIAALAIPEYEQPKEADLGSAKLKEKIEANCFSDTVVDRMREEISRFNQVQRFVSERDKIEPGFHNNLRGFFWRTYRELACREDGPFGDDLFYALYKTMQSRITETKYGELRALMPIITYLFVICDLFYRTKEERKRDEEAARAGGAS